MEINIHRKSWQDGRVRNQRKITQRPQKPSITERCHPPRTVPWSKHRASAPRGSRRVTKLRRRSTSELQGSAPRTAPAAPRVSRAIPNERERFRTAPREAGKAELRAAPCAASPPPPAGQSAVGSDADGAWRRPRGPPGGAVPQGQDKQAGRRQAAVGAPCPRQRPSPKAILCAQHPMSGGTLRAQH